MLLQKKEHPKEKSQLHPRNRHRERYDFKQLILSFPELAKFVKPNIYNDESIEFANPAAVLALNKALLKHYYDIESWDIPEGYLCPPIPGRADHIHHVAGLFREPQGLKVLDIGVGANCVYPIIGVKEYDWSFVGSEIDPIALESAQKIIAANPNLKNKVELSFQSNAKNIFWGIIKEGEHFDLVICNPPFHASLAEAEAGTQRKLKNLNPQKNSKLIRNFGGQNTELWCEGGEAKFIREMIHQSKPYSTNCLWFSTLVSKQSHLKSIYETLRIVRAADVKTISMGQGNKTSRIVAWTFLNPAQQQQRKQPIT